MKNVFITTTLLVTLLFPGTSAWTQCTGVTDERADYELYPESRAIHQKKVDYAISVISDKQYLSQNSNCVAKALIFLGQFHIEKAIPRMIELLGYEDKVENPLRGRTRNEEYPAIAGLAGMGKPAVPALLKALDTSKGDAVVIDNVMYALMTIYVAHPGDAIQILQKAAATQSDPLVATRLHDSILKAESIWCKDGSSCPSQPN